MSLAVGTVGAHRQIGRLRCPFPRSVGVEDQQDRFADPIEDVPVLLFADLLETEDFGVEGLGGFEVGAVEGGLEDGAYCRPARLARRLIGPARP